MGGCDGWASSAKTGKDGLGSDGNEGVGSDGSDGTGNDGTGNDGRVGSGNGGNVKVSVKVMALLAGSASGIGLAMTAAAMRGMMAKTFILSWCVGLMR